MLLLRFHQELFGSFIDLSLSHDVHPAELERILIRVNLIQFGCFGDVRQLAHQGELVNERLPVLHGVLLHLLGKRANHGLELAIRQLLAVDGRDDRIRTRRSHFAGVDVHASYAGGGNRLLCLGIRRLRQQYEDL